MSSSLKIFSIILNPLIMAIVLIFGGWFMLHKKTKFGSILVGFGLLFIFIFSWGPFSEILIAPLENRFPKTQLNRRIDGIIVLGGGFAGLQHEKVQIGCLNRAVNGLLLYREHPEAMIIISGGSASLVDQTYKEAEYIKDLLIKLGVANNRILIEPNSRNTHENAVNTAKLLKKYWREKTDPAFVLITSAFHMPRSIGCFRKEGIDPIPQSMDYRQEGNYGFFSLPTPEYIITARSAIKEWVGLMVYKYLGYTEEYFPSPRT